MTAAFPAAACHRRPGTPGGLTLIEMLITVAILSILAAVALPFAETVVQRRKEIELRAALRDIRSAIDELHADWEEGRIPGSSDAVSRDGYPVDLDVLVEGVTLAGVEGETRYYLRRIPRDPFADPAAAPAEQWVRRGYRDAPDAIFWGGDDVYDVRSASEREALDGTRYADW